MSLREHLNEIKRQRQILDDWQAYEYDLTQMPYGNYQQN